MKLPSGESLKVLLAILEFCHARSRENDKEVCRIMDGKTGIGWLYAFAERNPRVGNEEYCSTKMNDM